MLNLKLASKKTKGLGPVPMAGFPFWQLDRFLKILVQDLNRYVAISEEFPTDAAGKVKSGGLLFDRRVARIVTPGTLIDEKFLNPYENNFLLAIHPENLPIDDSRNRNIPTQDVRTNERSRKVGLAWLDLSTGDFFTQGTEIDLLPSALAQIGAREIILSVDIATDVKSQVEAVLGFERHLITLHNPVSTFKSMSQWNELLEVEVDSSFQANFTPAECEAGHQLLDYVRTRLCGFDMKLQPPVRRQLADILSIDRSSMRGLEILQTARDGLGRGSLLHAVNRTVTKSGARLLRDRLTSPSASIPVINERLDLLTVFAHNSDLRDEVSSHLRRTFDVQRLVQKFALNKGDADDMICLARAISATSDIQELLGENRNSKVNKAPDDTEMAQESLNRVLQRIDLSGPLELSERIAAAIDEDGLNQKHRVEEDEAASIGAFAKEIALAGGGPDELESLPRLVRTPKVRSGEARDSEMEVEEFWIMRRDANEAISRLHFDLDNLKEEKNELAKNLRTKLNAPSLTLKWTPGLGHICHVKNGNKALSSLDSLNARLVGSTKSTRSFYVTDWTQLGNRMEQTRLHIQGEEQRLFAELRQQVIRNLVKLRRNAAVMDELDVACSFAKLAEEQGLVRPIVNNSTRHKIIGGRHPTVKLGLEEQGRSFVSNDLFLGGEERIWLVTGPNMAGKSTFLRQNALITILAQVGSYVPAEHAEIGLVDQIFSRIGAADDLFRDQSTFMVEMLETAAILKHATSRSFVIMDEVGRGTTPEDGTAVGYAALHQLYHHNRCRTLFATHFHALADMTRNFLHMARYCTDILEDDDGSFTFVHRLRPGVNRQSHALKVAKLAGLPDSALDVAKVVLKQLLEEKHRLHYGPLFTEQDNSQVPSAASAG